MQKLRVRSMAMKSATMRARRCRVNLPATSLDRNRARRLDLIPMPKLLIAGVSHELSDQLISVGRSPENAIQVDDPSVSGRHAEFILSGENYELHDAGSTNGTRVNGAPITQKMLQPGDRVRFGGVEGCYECDPASSAQPLPVTQPVAARPAEISARPMDFANASPFGARAKNRDPMRKLAFALAAFSVLAWIGSMLAVLLMQAPNQ